MAMMKKGMQYNSMAPKEDMGTRNLGGKMMSKPKKGMMSKSSSSGGKKMMGGMKKSKGY